MSAKSMLNLMLLGLIITCLVGPVPAAQAKEPSAQAKEHYQKARKHFALAEREKGLEEIKAAINLAADFLEAHREFLDNQRDKAKELLPQYEELVKRHPENATYRYLLGKAYSNANERAKSDAEFQKALELDPDNGWALLAVGAVESRKGETGRALELWEKASKAAGDNPVLRAAIANSFVGRKVFDLALHEADRIIQKDPAFFEAYAIKWRARMNLTLGSEEVRAEVADEIKRLESSNGSEIRALQTVQTGYQMLDETEAAEKVKKAVLAIDPEFYNRQPFRYSFWTPIGKIVTLSGPAARRYSDIHNIKNGKEKIAAYEGLVKDVEDMEVKLYVIYPAMLRTYIAERDDSGAGRVLGMMTEAGIEARVLAGHRVELAQFFIESKTETGRAENLAQLAIEEFRKPPPKREGASSESQPGIDRSGLSRALHVYGAALLAKGLADQAVEALAESVALSEDEDNSLDLGIAYSQTGKATQAIEMLARAYAYEGKKKKQAKEAVQKIYGSRAKHLALSSMLNAAVERRQAQVRETAIKKALAEMAKIEVKSAPDFKLTTLEGEKISLMDLRGKVILLNFWATW